MQGFRESSKGGSTFRRQSRTVGVVGCRVLPEVHLSVSN
jgi:hypothetical protein